MRYSFKYLFSGLTVFALVDSESEVVSIRVNVGKVRISDVGAILVDVTRIFQSENTADAKTIDSKSIH